MGHVIGDHKAVETDRLERLDDLECIYLTAVDEGLVEVLHRPNDIAEVDVDDFLLATEVADGADDVVVAAHLRPAPHAEVEAVMRAVEGGSCSARAKRVARAPPRKVAGSGVRQTLLGIQW